MNIRRITALVSLAVCVAVLVSLWGARGGSEMQIQGNQTNVPVAATPVNKGVWKELTPDESAVMVACGTERPFSGEYWNYHEPGAYACRRCGALLFPSTAKFDSKTGWPSFDEAYRGAVVRKTDPDGSRTEIVCAQCGAHLGHVFMNEGFTAKQTRNCVNSISLKFIPQCKLPIERAIFAGGCFWGVEYYFLRVPGVLKVTSGFTGGTVEHPSYEQVCTGKTGHAEAVEVEYDPTRVSYETLARLFFEIHDPTQRDRQGPDIGEQYRSEVFYTTPQQKEVADKLIAYLRHKGMDVVTHVTAASAFWPAGAYHQNYYDRHGKQPYCHRFMDRFPAGPLTQDLMVK